MIFYLNALIESQTAAYFFFKAVEIKEQTNIFQAQ